MVKKTYFNFRMKMILGGILLLFTVVILVANFGFNKSRELLIEQEANIISQYMERNTMALVEVTDSIRKLSAASSTNKEISNYLNQSFAERIYSAENANRIKSVETTLSFYRNIFFDYRMHYVIGGSDGTVYSVVDGVADNAYFGRRFVLSTETQAWYRNFLKSSAISEWMSPCVYSKKGDYRNGKEEETDERYILFVRKIRDYNTLKDLGVSTILFPTENLSKVLTPYASSKMALFGPDDRLIYSDGEAEVFGDVESHALNSRMTESAGYFYYTSAQTEYLINYQTISGCDWKLLNVVPLKDTTKVIDDLYRMLMFLIVVISLAAVLMCLAMYSYVAAPFTRLVQKISSVHIGGIRLSERRNEPEGTWRMYGILEAEEKISHLVDYMEELSEQTIKQKEIEQNLRYEMLRAQLRPHFLFNTLNTIKWSAMISGAGNIADMITSLGILLESSMNRKGEEATLKDEVKVVEAWVTIKNWSLKYRINLQIDIPAELEDFRVIKFFLQPLVENAFLHGVENQEDGVISVSARRQPGQMAVLVKDNGVGISRDKLEKIISEMDSDDKKRQVTGIGLRSIHELMRMKYGEAYGLTLESEEGTGTQVTAVFPDNGGEKNAEGNDR